MGETLYAATVRTGSGGTESITGSLYLVNLGSGSATFIAPIRMNGNTPLGITGMAAHPSTGVMYGITSPLSGAHPQSLVTLEPNTGNATLVGDLRFPGSDIAFNKAGILFTWLPGSSQLGIVNLKTGAVTPIGNAGPAGTIAGLAIDDRGAAYITPSGAGGTLDTVDIATGAIRRGPQLAGAPFASAINSMTFTPAGLLLAVNSNAGSPAATRLVTINTATGAVSSIGTLPDDTDALAFVSSQFRSEPLITGQTLALLVLGVIALILGLIGWAVGRRPRAPPAP
ncbi:MAG TPA: hypothetical protein VFP36_13140 [Usitatibacter sp.]|nr:hypothetical protein [Usitatibacter sp.]